MGSRGADSLALAFQFRFLHGCVPVRMRLRVEPKVKQKPHVYVSANFRLALGRRQNRQGRQDRTLMVLAPMVYMEWFRAA